MGGRRSLPGFFLLVVDAGNSLVLSFVVRGSLPVRVPGIVGLLELVFGSFGDAFIFVAIVRNCCQYFANLFTRPPLTMMCVQ